jgi:ATP-dependent RNA/DNA helicase IGHMBP2
MNSLAELTKTLELLQAERQADLEQYKQKVMLLPLSRKTKEGKSWYPVRLVRHYIGTGERLIIEVERTQHRDQAHVFQSGKVVNLFCNARNTPGKEHEGGVINYVRDNTMVITLNSDELPDWIDDPLLGVDVMFDEMSYREMEYAVKEVMKAEKSRVAELREILLGYQLPVAGRPVMDDRQHETKLNSSQRGALNNIMTSTDVAIVHGPPGTGKTTTLVEAIKATVKEERQLLVTAPSNAAVDLLVDKLSEAGLKVLRIGHPARVTEQTLSKTLDARIAMHAHYRDLRSMRKKMEQLRETAFKYKRQYGYSERQQRKLLLQEAKALKADADVLEFYIINDLLQNSDVIACTLVGASHPTLRGKRYKTVFIDEAGQSLEPACWIPLLRAERVVFAGDHHQLPPTIKSVEAGKAGLSKTLFEKCIQRHPQTAVMLQTQYRMHEAIMHFPAKYFYEGKLQADDRVAKVLLEPTEPPLTFLDTAGCGFTEAQDPETLSRYNEDEGRFMISQVEKLIQRLGTDNWPFSIGIITPYSAQVERLIKLAETSEALSSLAAHITINTVDAFQGQERDIIAISLVRSNENSEVGFLGDIRRMNVAMTRAKKKLIIVGDSATLGSHPFYLELIEDLQQRNYYQSAYEVMY